MAAPNTRPAALAYFYPHDYVCAASSVWLWDPAHQGVRVSARGITSRVLRLSPTTPHNINKHMYMYIVSIYICICRVVYIAGMYTSLYIHVCIYVLTWRVGVGGSGPCLPVTTFLVKPEIYVACLKRFQKFRSVDRTFWNSSSMPSTSQV